MGVEEPVGADAGSLFDDAVRLAGGNPVRRRDSNHHPRATLGAVVRGIVGLASTTFRRAPTAPGAERVLHLR